LPSKSIGAEKTSAVYLSLRFLHCTSGPAFAPEARTSILVLTKGDRRLAALRQHLTAKNITAGGDLLPDGGRPAVAALIERLGGA